ncbi:DUF4190 domain-containing protein [Amycolatopsis dongchuanensis]|uniref:DUF4190 domain-containing protein n=1 Tax=Amycolatopsis dongchuanensis TaxID=1070866 RepID=A0ABP9PST7_9PSEU
MRRLFVLNAQPPYAAPQQQPGNGVAIGGMVTGIVGLVFGWFPVLGFILGAVAVVLSGVGIHNANTKNASGRGMAVAGLVCGILALLFGLFWILVIGAAASSAGVH